MTCFLLLAPRFLLLASRNSQLATCGSLLAACFSRASSKQQEASCKPRGGHLLPGAGTGCPKRWHKMRRGQAELSVLAGIADGITRAPRQRVSTSKSYRDLKAWQASMTVVERIYAATRRFPHDERFGLTSQLRRACVSMPANVAEGRARRSDRAFANHVSIALGSHGEAASKLRSVSDTSRQSNATI